MFCFRCQACRGMTCHLKCEWWKQFNFFFLEVRDESSWNVRVNNQRNWNFWSSGKRAEECFFVRNSWNVSQCVDTEIRQWRVELCQSVFQCQLCYFFWGEAERHFKHWKRLKRLGLKQSKIWLWFEENKLCFSDVLFSWHDAWVTQVSNSNAGAVTSSISSMEMYGATATGHLTELMMKVEPYSAVVLL